MDPRLHSEHLPARLKILRGQLNDGNCNSIIAHPTVGDLLDQYIAEERLEEIKARKPGERATKEEELSYSTALSYLSLAKQTREVWGAVRLDDFEPLKFQNWLKALQCKPKTKGHIKAFVNRLFNKAKLDGMISFVENPIRAGWCLVECPECCAAPGVRCSGFLERRKKRPLIGVYSQRREAATAIGYGGIGWHTFRHKYENALCGEPRLRSACNRS